MDRIVFATGPIARAATRRQPRRAFATRLSDAIGLEVVVVVAPTYNELGGLMQRRVAHVAWLPPAIYVGATDRGEAELLLAAVRARGSRFRGALFVRSGSAITGPADLKGACVAWVDRDSCSGYLFPRLALAELGLDLAGFSRQLVLGTHEAVARAVEVGTADVGATFVDQDADADDDVYRPGWSREVAAQSMRAVLVSRPIPADTICVASTMGPELRGALASALMGLHDTEEGSDILAGLFGAERFALGTASEYEVVRRAISIAG